MSSATLTASYGNNTSPDLTTYWRLSGIALAAVAGLGIVLNAIGAGALLGGYLTFDWTHNAVHVLLAAVGIVGFLSATVFGIGTMLGLHLEIGEDLVDLALGAWGTYVGFAD